MSEYIIDWDENLVIDSFSKNSLREEIVRCRDCRHCYACGSFMFCELRRPGEPVNADGYCAWGVKRKEGGYA